MTLKEPQINHIRELRKQNLKYNDIVNLTEHGKSTVVKYSKDIKVKIKRIVKRRKVASIPKMMTVEKARIIAHLQGDGSVTSKMIKYSNNCLTLVKLFHKDFKMTFGFEAGRIRCDGGNWVAQSGARDAIEYLQNYKFSSRKWAVPEEIFDSSKKTQVEYIKSLFDDDGTIIFYDGTWRLRLYSVNKNALMDIRNILNNFNIISFVQGPYGPRKKYQLEIARKKSVRIFCKKICFFHPEKLKKSRIILKTINCNS